jgi:hypothetical protein
MIHFSRFQVDTKVAVCLQDLKSPNILLGHDGSAKVADVVCTFIGSRDSLLKLHALEMHFRHLFGLRLCRTC